MHNIINKTYTSLSYNILLIICNVSSMGRALDFRAEGPGFKPRPGKTYKLYSVECPYKMNDFSDYSVYLCI